MKKIFILLLAVSTFSCTDLNLSPADAFVDARLKLMGCQLFFYTKKDVELKEHEIFLKKANNALGKLSSKDWSKGYLKDIYVHQEVSNI